MTYDTDSVRIETNSCVSCHSKLSQCSLNLEHFFLELDKEFFQTHIISQYWLILFARQTGSK